MTDQAMETGLVGACAAALGSLTTIIKTLPQAELDKFDEALPTVEAALEALEAEQRDGGAEPAAHVAEAPDGGAIGFMRRDLPLGTALYTRLALDEIGRPEPPRPVGEVVSARGMVRDRSCTYAFLKLPEGVDVEPGTQLYAEEPHRKLLAVIKHLVIALENLDRRFAFDASYNHTPDELNTHKALLMAREALDKHSPKRDS